eukprot:gene7292-8107_t
MSCMTSVTRKEEFIMEIDFLSAGFSITPYRDLKRPSNLKRSNSLRSTPGKFRDENENMKAKGRGSRPKSIGPGAKLLSNTPKSPRGKVTGGKKMSVDVAKEELYPTSVFERESSDSARKAIRGGRKRNKPANTIAMDMYNTVWLSDYESCKSEPDSLNQSIVSSLNHSRSTAMSMSESVTPFGTPGSSRPITPSRFTPIGDHNNGSLEDDRLSINSVGRKKLARTLSLPESEFATLDARDLQERFTRLQLEHENKELKKLTNDLQDALEKLEQQFLDRLHKDEDGDHRTPALSPNPRSPFFERNHDNQFSYDHNDRDSLDSRDHDYRRSSRNDYSIMISKRDRPSIHGFYKIGKIIGDGNFAVVRECRNRRSGVDYALKVINKAKVRGKEHMIENEILILRRVKHPHIVQLIEEFETAKEILLVMELVPEGDLFDAIVEATKFTEKDACHMIRDLASAVKYLHELKIVHRDIKPENLLVVKRPDGNTSLKLADFGLSIEVKSPMFLVCGTPTYVAPEILDESGYGLEVDVWAIGVITYILLCGFPPFRSQKQDQEELFDKILNGEFEYLSPFWDDVSESAKDLINHLLVVNVKKRYTADDILANTWIQGHTAKNTNLQVQLSSEISKNFTHKRRLRGVALAIQTVIYLSNIIQRKRAEIRQTHSCVEFSHLHHPVEQNKTLASLDQKQPVLFTTRSNSFEESRSFERDDSYDEEGMPSSYPGSPAKRASVSSRIPRAKSTTPRQHIEDIRKSISNTGRNVQCRNKDSMGYSSKAEQFEAIGDAYQNVYGHKTDQVSDLKPPSVTLRTSRPNSAKESGSSRRLSLHKPSTSSTSLPPSPRHDHVVNVFAPGVKKRMPYLKCVSVDERRPRSGSLNQPNAISSLTEHKNPAYRASYPNRNSSYFTSSVNPAIATPRYPRKLSYQAVKPDKQVSSKPGKQPAPVRKTSVVKKRIPSASSTTTTTVQTSEQEKKTSESIGKISNIACRTAVKPDVKPDDVVEGNFDSSSEGNIRIVTKTNKTENIKIHHGKTVDKSVETSTTVSVKIDNEKKKATTTSQSNQKPFGLGRALLTKVKQLADEIETLAMSTMPDNKEPGVTLPKRSSFPHVSNVPGISDASAVRVEDVGNTHSLSTDLAQKDSFSETEYLSLNTRPSRNGNTGSSDTDTDMDNFF